MTTFKPGDKVRRTRPTPAFMSQQLEVGKIYEVRYDDEWASDGVHLVGFTPGYSRKHFELANDHADAGVWVMWALGIAPQVRYFDSTPKPWEVPVYLNASEIGALRNGLRAWVDSSPHTHGFSRAYATAYAKLGDSRLEAARWRNHSQALGMNTPFVTDLEGTPWER